MLIRFSRVTHLGCIRPYAYVVVDLFWHRLGFLDLRILGVFDLVPRRNEFIIGLGQVFPTHMSQVHLSLRLLP